MWSTSPRSRRPSSPSDRGPVVTDSPADLVEAARTGDRAATARLLSLVERGGDPAAEIGRLTHPLGGEATTVGITGPPGAGKSTLTSDLVAAIRREGEQVGVLAIDPSSPFTGGAILGDRVRMGDHATDEGVFIRSMASRGHLGGPVAGHPRGGPGARRGRLPLGGARDRGRGPGGGGGRRSSRHDRRGGEPGVGRRGPGRQGRPARDGRRLRDQQGRPTRGRSRPDGTSSRCSTSPPITGGDPRSSRP